MPAPTPPTPSGAPATEVAERLARLRERVAAAAHAANRDPRDVRILLATKTMPLEVVRAAVEAGADLLGENRVQEVLAKAPGLAACSPELHLIGHLQSNKVAAALDWVSCVQSVDTLALAERLSRRCLAIERELDVMVQVNVSGESTKHGVRPSEAPGLAAQVAKLPRLHLTGFMTIGERSKDPSVVRAGLRRLREVRDAVLASRTEGTEGARELSMGMSGDLELAIAEGSTIVRIGSAVFGERSPAGG